MNATSRVKWFVLGVSSVIATGVVLALVVSSSASGTAAAPTFSRILTSVPQGSANSASATPSNAEVQQAVESTSTCVRSGVTGLATSLGFKVSLTLPDAASTASAYDVPFRWSYSVVGAAPTSESLANFKVGASAIQKACQSQSLDGVVTRAKRGRRASLSYLNAQAAGVAICLQSSESASLSPLEISDIVRAIAMGGRPDEPLANKVNGSQALRTAIAECVSQHPAVVPLPATDN